MTTRVQLIALLACAFACAPLSCTGSGTTSPRPAEVVISPAETTPRDLAGLHNVVAFSPSVYSGSLPDSPDSFQSLQAMGIKTIISVDGSKPDVQSADARGMRYVHLPIGYDGMKPERTLELARALRDLPHPVYVHCHHGKHRSACAAGAALVTLGELTPDAAVARMNVSGTSPSYKGLFQTVRAATPASQAVLDAANNTFPSIAVTTGMVDSMVVIDHDFENLKLVKSAGWVVPADHPDLVPVAIAGRIADQLRVLAQSPESAKHGDDFVAKLMSSATSANAVEQLLVKSPADKAALTSAFEQLATSCNRCHAEFRN